MMHVMHLHREEERNVDIVARVVERCKDPTGEDKKCHGIYMTRNEIDGKEVKIFSHGEFEGVDVDCVYIATRWSFLPMMMLLKYEAK